ncbi:HAD family hydrolase, partial [Aquabacterium sp. A08]|uniref:HAD family hydrolase n=1 Tax=Aquabacterium sp. A08 TaxID=2718532 RepID=UPI00142315F6
MLNLARIRAITLDLDDTLWPIWPTIERAEGVLQAWLAEHAPATAALLTDPEQRRAIRAAVNRDLAEQAHDLTLLRREAIRRALVLAGDPEAHAEPAFEVFFAERQRVTLYEDALPALQHLAARFPLVALSNGNADVHRVGLGVHFHASVSAREQGCSKPDPRIFRAAADRAGVPPEAVLHIGDDPGHDVLGALGVGMQAVWLNREGREWPHES